ncbi:MAG TPA: hypothetical protein VF200_06340 [Woeseiaceae bacterium]
MSALINGACTRVRAGLETEALDLLERAFARGCGKRDWSTIRITTACAASRAFRPCSLPEVMQHRSAPARANH